jgi:TetR/AcrR family transcriptional regulator, fatty acid metabolism regulator protein
MTPRTVDRTARRAELISAASGVFAERGVANTTVSDIVRSAGVAQGTFYLYFDSKEDVVLAVVHRIGDDMLAGIESAVSASGTTAVEKLLGLRDVLVSFDEDPEAIELAEFMHRPENQAVHARLAENLTPRLIPLVESIVRQGVSEGVFDVPDAHAAAWFVLAGLQSAELSGTATTDMPAAIAAATQLALRALGCREDVAS